MNLNKWMMTAAVAALMLSGAACSSKGGQLSVSARAATATATTPDAGTSGGSLDLGQGVLVSEVQAVVKRVTLHVTQSGTSADGGSDSSSTQAPAASQSAANQAGGQSESEIENESEGDEVKIGPFLVDLKGDALANKTLTNVFDTTGVPTGTFQEIKIVIAPDTSELQDGSSVVITGTIDSKDFTFKSSLHAAQKIESDVAISDTAQNVTLTVDPSGWFKDSAGNRLDPTNTDPANQSQIEDNIRRSIKGFCDRDRDGEDDATEHSDGGSAK